MKKLLILLLVLFSLTGCGTNSAKGVVEGYLRNYRNLDSEVLVDLEEIISKENLNSDLKDKYRDVLKKQYKDLEYEIVDEEYDGDVTYVTAKIKVYDLHAAKVSAENYLVNNQQEFMVNDAYDHDKYLEYKLDRMKNTTDRKEFTIIFTVNKEDDKYVVNQPTDMDLEKIHGIYNYELD